MKAVFLSFFINKSLFIFKNKLLESGLKTFSHKGGACQQVGLPVRLPERNL